MNHFDRPRAIEVMNSILIFFTFIFLTWISPLLLLIVTCSAIWGRLDRGDDHIGTEISMLKKCKSKIKFSFLLAII